MAEKRTKKLGCKETLSCIRSQPNLCDMVWFLHSHLVLEMYNKAKTEKFLLKHREPITL